LGTERTAQGAEETEKRESSVSVLLRNSRNTLGAGASREQQNKPRRYPAKQATPPAQVGNAAG